jgi:ribose 5-phosphate isomerase A
METADLKKRRAGEKATEYIKDGMMIGLGSGSTVYWTMKKLGELIKEGLQIKGIPSSKRTEGWAKEFGIPLTDFSETQTLDIAIDGADEIDKDFNLIKGGGGSLVREKFVDIAAGKFIVIADDSKMVDQLGAIPLPVEVVPFGWELTSARIASLGCEPALRKKDGKVFISDNGNFILDCQFSGLTKPEEIHQQLKMLLGVVETGLFINMADILVIGNENGTEVIEKE